MFEIISLGTDIIEISRIKAIYDRFKDKFLNKIYTNKEIKYCLQKSDIITNQRLSSHFVAKEATIKTLRHKSGISFRQIEIQHKKNGAPFIKLYGNTLIIAKNWGINDFLISMSHCHEYAIATVIGIRIYSGTENIDKNNYYIV